MLYNYRTQTCRLARTAAWRWCVDFIFDEQSQSAAGAALRRSGSQHASGDTDHGIHGDGKADALSTSADGYVDADQFTVDIQQRAARVARINAGVGLDQRLVGYFLVETDIAADGTDNANGDRMFVAIGIAN